LTLNDCLKSLQAYSKMTIYMLIECLHIVHATEN